MKSPWRGTDILLSGPLFSHSDAHPVLFPHPPPLLFTLHLSLSKPQSSLTFNTLISLLLDLLA